MRRVLLSPDCAPLPRLRGFGRLLARDDQRLAHHGGPRGRRRGRALPHGRLAVQSR